MLLNKLTELKKCCTKEQFTQILEETTRDIKFNRIGFNKRTSQNEFKEILDITANVILNM